MNIVITGANRGIGLELARQYLARGDTVHAGVRTPHNSAELNNLAGTSGGRLHVVACDVAIQASVLAFAAAITHPVDILINNAGMKSDNDELEALDLEAAERTLQVNTLGPLRVVTALLPSLRRSGKAKVANISSGWGSIERNTTGGHYSYRMSKAALNMASHAMAQDLRSAGIVAVALSPGWVRTDMGGPDAPTPVSDSAAGLIGLIDRLTLQESGEFYDFRGERIPW